MTNESAQIKGMDELLYRQRHSAAHIMAEAVLDDLPRGEVRHRPADRERLLLRLRPAAAADAGGPRDDRQAACARASRRTSPSCSSEASKDEARAFFADQPYKLELIDGIPDADGRHLQARQLHRPLRLPPRREHGQGRRLQADQRRRRLLARRRAPPDAAAHLRRHVPDRGGAGRATCTASRRRSAATTAASARSSSCSSSTRSRRAARSSCPRARRSTTWRSTSCATSTRATATRK